LGEEVGKWDMWFKKLVGKVERALRGFMAG